MDAEECIYLYTAGKGMQSLVRQRLEPCLFAIMKASVEQLYRCLGEVCLFFLCKHSSLRLEMKWNNSAFHKEQIERETQYFNGRISYIKSQSE